MDGIKRLFGAVRGKSSSLQKAASPKKANWTPLTDEQINQEYEWEYPHVKRHFGDIWPTVEHFRQAVKGGRVTPIDEKTDAAMSNRSHTRSLDSLKGLVSTYRYPRDVDRIKQGLEAGSTLPTPIVLRHPETGHHHIMSGNTRMDTANILGYEPHATVVDMPSQKPAKIQKSLANSDEKTPEGPRWQSVFIASRKGKMTKSEPLDKAGAMKRFPYNPNDRSIAVDKKLYGWQQDAKPEFREKLPRMEGNGRQRALHKLSGKTKSMVGPDGKRYYLLHRGMSPEEKTGSINHEKKTVTHKGKKTSWTPDFATAKSFASDYDHSKYREDPNHGVTSAWVHEDDIHTIPNQFGQYMVPERSWSLSDTEAKWPKKPDVKRKNEFRHEYEVVLRPGHKSHLTTPSNDMVTNKTRKLSGIHSRINARGKTEQEYERDKKAGNASPDERDRNMRFLNSDIKYAHNEYGLKNETKEQIPLPKKPKKPKAKVLPIKKPVTP